MRNRAKCKLCSDILESFHQFDWVTCRCGEVSITGGNVIMECSAKDWNNFLRVDDHGNVIIPKVLSKDDVKLPHHDSDVILPSKSLSFQEKLFSLRELASSIESLPKHVMESPITHYDFYSFLVVLVSALEEVEPRPSSEPPSQDQ